jgi:hypothetical protein
MATQKPSLAVDLARQAAAAAKAEVQAEEAASVAATTRWQPAELGHFSLHDAVASAVASVSSHLARALHYEGLEVAAAAPLPHSLPKEEAATIAVQVQEGVTGRLVRGYSTPAVLSLFASQQQRNGVVVDGQV